MEGERTATPGPAWSSSDLRLRDRTYGVRSRVRRFRSDLRNGGWPLVRWFPRSWFTDPLAMVDICSPWEVAWVTRHMALEHRDVGAVVELGPWLGDITLGILRGLDRRSTSGSAVVDSFDLFVFDDIEERSVHTPLAGRWRNGDDFLPVYRRRLGDSAHRVRAHQGDILAQEWPGDVPIEFLFDDVAKTWEIWNHLRATFYRALRPGSTVVEQDWAHACTPWLHLWHHRHRAHFEHIGQVPNAGSVAFRMTDPLPDAAFEPEGLTDYTDDEVRAAFDWAARLVDPTRRANVRAAYVQLYTLHGDLDRAIRLCVAELAGSRVDSELISIAVPVLAERLAATEHQPRTTP